MTALTFGNVHGVYKPGNVKLRPEILKAAQEAVVAELGLDAGAKPFDLVFHGGSGSTAEEIGAAVDYGVIKMNVDTDTQYAFTRPVAAHMFANYDGVLKVDGEVGNKKAYDPRALGQGGRERHGRAHRRGLPEPALGGHLARRLSHLTATTTGRPPTACGPVVVVVPRFPRFPRPPVPPGSSGPGGPRPGTSADGTCAEEQAGRRRRLRSGARACPSPRGGAMRRRGLGRPSTPRLDLGGRPANRCQSRVRS